MIKYFEISTGTPPLHLAESTTREGVEIISWLSSEFYKGENATGSVLYTPQSLTPEQQSQSRINIGLANVDNTSDANKPISTAVANALLGKQNSLTLSVNDNGNIVIGNLAGQTKEFMPATPSGDPMHYAYVKAGAVWNETNGWTLNGISMTNDEIKTSYYYTHNLMGMLAGGFRSLYFNGRFKTNFRPISPTTMSYIDIIPTEFMYDGSGDLAICEVFALSTSAAQPTTSSYKYKVVGSAYYMMRNQKKLREIWGALDVSNATNLIYAFMNCEALQTLWLYNLAKNVNLGQSPNLSKESILYMIENEVATSAIVITLHATAYAMAMADTDITAALAEHTNVSLASA